MRTKTMAPKVLALILMVLLLVSCDTAPTATVAPTNVPAQPTFTAQPTINLQPTLIAVQTQAVQTAMAVLTQNAPTAAPTKPAVTATTIPTTTPAAATSTPVKPTATATVVIPPAVQTDFTCALLSSTPLASDNLTPRLDFDAVWVVLNTGTEVWDNTNVDLRFISGDKLQKYTEMPKLSTSVAKNEKYTFTLDMTAPADPGEYYANYAVMHGSRTVCTMTVNIRIK